MIKKITILISVLLIISCSSSKKITTVKESRIMKEGTFLEMNSEEFLTKNNTWYLKSTENIKFYFDKSFSQSFINEVINAQKENYKHVVNLMKVDKSEFPKVTFFLFKDKAQKKQLTLHASDAHAINPNVYYLPKNAKGAQEVGHIITQTIWGFIPNNSEYALLIDEGFNFFIDDTKVYKNKLDQYAKEFFKLNPDFKITSLTENGNGLRNNGGHELYVSYLSGSFVKYLVNKYGIHNFAKIWKSAVVNEKPDFVSVYNKNLNKLANDYKAYLENL